MKKKKLFIESRAGLKLAKDVVAVSEKAIIRRINRFIIQGGFELRKTRRAPSNSKQAPRTVLGTFYVVELGLRPSGDRIVEKHVDLETFARKWGVLATYESIA